jgi:hypothetical protein
MESSILEIINQIESRLSLHALDDHDEPAGAEVVANISAVTKPLRAACSKVL